MRKWFGILAVVVCPVVAFAQFKEVRKPTTIQAVSAPELVFEENLGQTNRDVRFIARGLDYTVFITGNEVVLARHDRDRQSTDKQVPVTRLQFAGSNGARVVEGVDRLPGVSNYYRGTDASRWQRNVPRYASVRLADVYPGIDFVCYGNGGQLEYDFVVSAGADASQIRLRSVGTRNLRVDSATGDLVADAERGTIRHHAPIAQEAAASTSTKHPVTARFRIDENHEVRFDVPDRNKERMLTIDPTIIWSTLHGGNDEDAGLGIVADSTGASYLTGYTSSTDFPTQSPAQGSNASNYTTDYFDVFVSKFTADGQTLVYSTYFGGEKDDYGIAIAIDSANAAYVTGRTESAVTFPIASPSPTTAYQATNAGGNYDAFVFKLSATGQVVYSTFIGGSLEDGGEGIAVDAAGNAYVDGYTWSIGSATKLFPKSVTLGPGGGVQDGFSLKLNPTGSALTYSAIVGGSADETLEALDIDGAGNAYIIGRTQSNDFPTVLPIQGTRKGGYDVTMSRINAAGTSLDYSTYLGGNADDFGIAIQVDAAGNAYGTGHVFEWTNRTVNSDTNPFAFPTTPGVVQRTNLGNWDVFLAKLTPAGQFGYSTLLGAPSATSEDQAYGIGVDSKGNATFAGNTNIVGTRDVFLGKINSTATTQLYGQLIQGSSNDYGRDLAFDQRGYAYITGYTQSANFGAPLVNPRQSTHAGGTSAFVVVLTDSVNLAVTNTDSQTTDTPGTSISYTITVSNSGPTAASGVTVFDDFDDTRLTGITWTATSSTGVTGFDPSGSGDINDTGINFPVNSSVTYTVNATIAGTATGTLTNTATATESNDVVDVNTTNNSATDTTTLVPAGDLSITKTDGVTTATPGGSVNYVITASNSGPNPITNAAVSDTFPAPLTCSWTCTGAGGGSCTAAGIGNINDTANLPAGGSATYTATCSISPSATGTISNTATVSAAGTSDSNPANNSATDSDTLSPQANLAITKTDGVTTATPGGSVTYTITGSNAGPSNASGATIADTFPAALTCTWTCAGAGGGTCTAAGSGNINDTVNLPSGGSVTYTASCTVSSLASGTLSNTATIAAPSGVTDPTPGNNSATDSDTLSAQSDLSITKTDGVTTATPGGSVTYTITGSNAGPSNASGATIADTFPAALTCTWTCAGAGGGTCTAAGSSNINDTVNLPSGGSVTYTASCTVSSLASGTLSNTATIAAPAGVTDPTPANNSATDSDTLSPQANLSITKTDGVTTATPGGSVTYTITGSNAGPSNASGATIADTFPASLTCSWTCAGAGGGTCTTGGSGNINDTVNLPSGGSVTYTASCTVSSLASGTLSNTATISAPAGVTDPTPGNNSATDSDTLTAQSDLSITKTDGVTTATPGGSVTYTITGSNAGPSGASGATITDTFPAALTCSWTCVGAGGGTCTAAGSGNINDTVNLPSGGSVTYTASCTVSSFASGTLSNTATVTAPQGVTDPTPANNSATDSDTLTAQSDLSITKTDGVTTATPGGSVTYTITGSNAGPSNASGATIADTFPAALTCTWTCAGAGGGTCTTGGSGNINDTVNLPSGGSVSYTASCTVSSLASGTLSNTATVAAPAGVTDPIPGNNSATDSDTLSPQANLAITKTDGVTTATPGGSVTYTITGSNAGPSNASGATIADTFPAALTCTWTCAGAGGGTCTAAGSGNITDTVNLPSGGSVTYAASCTVSSLASGTLSNTATIAAPAGVTDPTPGNNSATDSDTLTAQSDLSITKTDGVTTATPGGSVTYTVTGSNAGPSGASGATIADTFPAALTCTWTCAGAGGGTCTAAGSGNISDTVNLPSGGSVSYTASCTVSSLASGTLSNTATIAAPAGVTDPTPGNNSATDSDTLSPTADLSVTKTDSPDPVAAGGQIVYSIALTNQGPSDAASVTLTDALPAGTTFASLAQNSGPLFSCATPAAGGNGSVTCSIASFGASASATFTLTVNVTTGGPTITNTATATSATTDNVPANNSASATTTVLGAANVSGTKSVTSSGPLAPGSDVEYTIVLTNNGSATQPNNAGDELTDVLPSGLVLESASATSGTAVATIATNTVAWNGSLAPGASVTITIRARISATAGSTISNQGTISYDSNGDGTNDATQRTDDPAVAGSNDPTVFQVAGAEPIPFVSPFGLLLMAVVLGAAGLVFTRRI